MLVNLTESGNYEFYRLQSHDTENYETLHRKRIWIATCNFGNGHNQTAQGLKENFENQGAIVKVCNTTTHIFNTQEIRKYDTLYKVSQFLGAEMRTVDAFNWSLTNKHYWIFNYKHKIESSFRYAFGLPGHCGIVPPSKGTDTPYRLAVRDELDAHNADAIVSVYHMDLNPLIEEAERRSIPIINIPTDFSVKADQTFLRPVTYKYFKTMVPYDDAEVWKTTTPLTKDQCVLGGVPIRPQLLKQHTKEEVAAIRKEKHIPDDAKVILFQSGGNGAPVPAIDILANDLSIMEPLHLVVVCGKNTAWAEELKNRYQSEGPLLRGSNPLVTIEIAQDKQIASEEFPYFVGAEELNRLYDISSATFAKSGGISCAESVYKGIPILFDCTTTPFYWEGFNIERMQEWGIGETLENYGDIYDGLKTVLAFERKVPKQVVANPYERINNLVSSMIANCQFGEYKKFCINEDEEEISFSFFSRYGT